MRPARVRRVEVRLDDHPDAAPDDAVAVAAAQRSLHTADAFVRNPLEQAHVELELVPLHIRALDANLCAHEGEL